ncbi:MAG: alpha-amylase family glycosyl hydrolase [Bacteroidia bacterium]
MKQVLLLLSICLPLQIHAQVFPDSAVAKGYIQKGDTTIFVFSPKHYNVEWPQQATVTGSFRNWSQDMDDPHWVLGIGADSLWILRVYNPNFDLVPPRAEFKFRINAGQWLQPPAGTPNEKGSNLVFMQHMTLPALKAELRRSGNIWASVKGTSRPLDPAYFRLTDAHGHTIPIATILPNEADNMLIVPATPIDIRRVYYLEIPAQKLKAWCSYEGWFRETYSTKPLGANIADDKSQTVFRLFAPRAENVKLYLYHNPADTEAYRIKDMSVDENGVWESTFEENLAGIYYDFTVHGANDPGNHFYETNPVHISDPYSRVNVESWGKSRVWPKTIPATPLRNGRPPMQDVISYEVHVQDFTDLLPVPENEKGTLPAFTKPGLKNSKGEPVGFDYLDNLGINVVHLMPVQEFLHYPDDDWRASFENDPFMIEQGINLENYQWGYRTSHAFAVENRFRRKGDDYGAEREQFRDLVQAFHNKDMAVIIDLVPNHSAENMDKINYYFHWNAIDKIYHYRTRDLDHIGEYGNEIKFENRPMVQRWLIDQCKHFIEEFGIDGFRIDLAGQVDRQTLIKLREALGPDIIIYGEPWIGSFDPEFEENPSWDWYKHNSPITFFQDETRNALHGPPSTPTDKGKDRGYAGANFHEKENAKKALANRFADDKTPLSGIGYLDIHDNWAMADRYAIRDWDGRYGVDEERLKIAALMLYTSLGPIVTHGGTEMMRSKGVAELKETLKVTKSGTKVYLHGKRDTYNMRKANQFVWENAGKTKKDKGSFCDYDGMYKFWSGLNHFRLSEYGKVFRVAEAVPDGYYRWVETVNPYQLGYIVADKVFVLINTGSEFHDWDNVVLPSGKWRLIGNIKGVDHKNGVKDEKNMMTLEGGKPLHFRLYGPEFKMWVRD